MSANLGDFTFPSDWLGLSAQAVAVLKAVGALQPH